MSEPKNKVFIYTEKSSGRIIYVKKSAGLDFSIPGQDWVCNEVAAPLSLASNVIGTHIWDATHGLQPMAALGSAEATRFRLLQKKLEVLIGLRATLHVIWIQAKPSFSNKKILSIPVREQNFKKLWRLVQREKHQLKNRIGVFFENVRSKIEAAPTIEKVESEYQHIVNNVTLGGYAASSRDIGESHVQRN